VVIDKHSFRVAVSDGYLELTELQLAGKKRLRVEDFLRGFKAEEGLTVE
jgi:methionyl-tRNA formyltransferase